MATPRKTQGSSPSSLMELSFQPLLKAFEDLTLDSGYGGMASSCRSSVLSLSPSHLDTPPPGTLWTLREAVGRDGGDKGLAGRETWATLPPLEWAPWTEEQLGVVMRRSLPSWRLSQQLLRQVSVRLGRALQRVALEARRLGLRCGKCTKQEVQAAARLLLSWALAEVFVGAGARALSQYSMSVEDPWMHGKSALCGLDLSVGRVFRWMVEARVAPLVHEHAAIYLAAGLQALLEVLGNRLGRAPPDHRGALSQAETDEAEQQALDRLLDADAELWGLFQPYRHLMCGRNAYGVLVLPSYLSVYSRRSMGRAGGTLPFRVSELQTLESSLLSTTVDSVSELSALVINTMYCLQRISSGSSSAVDRAPFHQRALCWEPGALHTLFYYTHVQREGGRHSPESRGPQLCTERPEAWLPPLCEWLRACIALAEHRHSLTVDSGDVQQAARLLLPGVDVEPRPLRVECCLYASKRLEAPAVKRVLCWNLAFRMLTCGRTDLVASAVALLGPDGVNTLDQQGLSPLMYTCANGDEAMVQVPGAAQLAPCAHPETRHWTALSFAVAFGHTSVAQQNVKRLPVPVVLLVTPEAHFLRETVLMMLCSCSSCWTMALTLTAVREKKEPRRHPCSWPRPQFTLTDLGCLSLCPGRYPLVSLLLERGADPLSGTCSVIGGSSSLRGMTTAFSLAAAHGHRTVLWTLLSTINSDMVSLEDMLAEGLVSRTLSTASWTSPCSSDKEVLPSRPHRCSVKAHGHRADRETTSCLRTSFSQQRWDMTHSLLGDFPTLQDVYSKELVCDGLPLLFNILNTCQVRSSLRRTLCQLTVDITALFRAASGIASHARLSPCPLFCSQSESTVHQLAAILSSCYGSYPVPAVHECAPKPHTPLVESNKSQGIPVSSGEIFLFLATLPTDPLFLNNKEMCDITFLVEDKPFYGHKELVSSACPGLEKLISQVSSSSLTPVEVPDIKYSTFQLVMQYIYSGGVQGIHLSKQEAVENDVQCTQQPAGGVALQDTHKSPECCLFCRLLLAFAQVLHVAHVFGLKVLKRHCEVLCSKCIYPSDAASVYRQAKAGQGFNGVAPMSSCELSLIAALPSVSRVTSPCLQADQASELKRFCEGYFLKNMVALLDVSSFRRLLLASEEKDALGKDLLHTLTTRMQALGQPVAKETMTWNQSEACMVAMETRVLVLQDHKLTPDRHSTAVLSSALGLWSISQDFVSAAEDEL
ncbi:ankyrin repeat and BTB/POZ domain-containing protein BTBD11-B-like [Scleropages formosus]|uniref:Ankyrin repeat and BTB/POZ domain-containing protein BTBD11-B-like n=1 Tax=Scleropages formosus TaxID=113540 RepID=A0A0P7WDV2_SCLFO|nr:ankyrin repeat and BTB/POZ domain-containing protein BTBD11-B-like [Scleropages formosus]